MVTNSQDVALQVIQQAIAALAKWADFDHPQLNNEYPQVTRAKEILGWRQDTEVGILRLLFDSVKLPDGKGQDREKRHYHPLEAIKNENREYPKIPYPLADEPSNQQIKSFKNQIQDEISKDIQNNWNSLSYLLALLEKFGSCLSLSEADVSLVDMARSTAAVAAALIGQSHGENISLIAGDISGIQKFIYTISSDGALKSLRARSFYLELVIQEVVQQLLEEIKLPITNIIYAGGGNFYLISSGNLELVKDCIVRVSHKFNKWLLNNFQGKLFLAIDCISIPTKDLENKKIADYWTKLTKNLANQKARKFSKNINLFIKESSSHEPCRVCHRDDLSSLKPLSRLNLDSSPACWVCRTMFELGDNLFDVNVVLRSKRPNIKHHVGRVYIPGYYYYFFTDWQLAIKSSKPNEAIFLVNDWELSHYQSEQTLLLLLGNYGKESDVEPGRFIRAEEMAQAAKKLGAIPRVGYLRMDVDRLGRIFAEGLDKNNRTLPRIAGLSRQMSYFFKVYLNTLAAQRESNIPDNIKQLKPKDRRLNLLFIYAGGDDLFISGAWNEIVELSFDIYQSFRAYTGYNRDITLSGGISIEDIKFPLYQAADSSGEAEDAAKGNGRDSLGLFSQVFKWNEWLGHPDNTKFDEINERYKYQEVKPNLLGIFPFVKRLEQQNIGSDYAHSFVQNLLITAQIQEEALKKFKDNQKEKEVVDTRYYLHLPKIAYTLARLPKNVLDDVDFRTSLKSPYNAPYFRAIATWIELLTRE
ncbi:type III-A CRISPR-associated protein Cas10/Csm1 [Nostocaceae cyanobacterium CENA369]|uniref:CRISPR system single-strand-specific deoxyribonuclease Cas10/Csm1 (subtype III-A) n=2 Tax=Dendronalium TaxID=2840442 RepID=A0A8J7LIE7_9NOST|nr:type III-A CRISPR-associated protein Cas10/Csm1 [Dendronalium phyllosphericum CENA369]